MNQRRFIKNAALLTGTGLVLRAAGLLLRVLVAALLGEQGMGLYSLTFTVYGLFITLAQCGVGVAATRLCSAALALRQPGRARGALRRCLLWSLILGGLAGACLFGAAPFLAARWIGSADCAEALRILGLSLPMMAVSGCFSGYFISRRNVAPGCIAQTAEQAMRLAITAAAIVLCRRSPFSLQLAAIVAANTVSEGLSCLLLALFYRKAPLPGEVCPPERGAIRRIALPVAGSRLLSTALHTTENMLIPAAIARYSGSYAVGLAQFGALRGMTIPLLFFPASFLAALSSLLVPEITDTAARADAASTRRIAERALRITVWLSVLIGGVFFLYGRQLGLLLFHSETVGMMLRVLAPITPFMYLDTIADGLLKGLDQQRKTLRNNTVDSCARILLIAVLVPFFGIYGYLAVMVVSNILVASLNLGTLFNAARLSFDWRNWVWKPLTGVGLACAVWALFPFRAGVLPMICGIAAWCGVYLLWLTLHEKNTIIKLSKRKENGDG